jgi:hypothetical protein
LSSAISLRRADLRTAIARGWRTNLRAATCLRHADLSAALAATLYACGALTAYSHVATALSASLAACANIRATPTLAAALSATASIAAALASALTLGQSARRINSEQRDTADHQRPSASTGVPLPSPVFCSCLHHHTALISRLARAATSQPRAGL